MSDGIEMPSDSTSMSDSEKSVSQQIDIVGYELKRLCAALDNGLVPSGPETAGSTAGVREHPLAATGLLVSAGPGFCGVRWEKKCQMTMPSTAKAMAKNLAVNGSCRTSGKIIRTRETGQQNLAWRHSATNYGITGTCSNFATENLLS